MPTWMPKAGKTKLKRKEIMTEKIEKEPTRDDIIKAYEEADRREKTVTAKRAKLDAAEARCETLRTEIERDENWIAARRFWAAQHAMKMTGIDIAHADEVLAKMPKPADSGDAPEPPDHSWQQP